MAQIDGDVLGHALQSVRDPLERILQTILASAPSAFVSPRLWTSLSYQIIALGNGARLAERLDETDGQDVRIALPERVEDCRARVNGLMCATEADGVLPAGSATLRLIEVRRRSSCQT
jgi:hypothetical protein